MVSKPAPQMIAAQCPDCGNNINLRGPLRTGQDVICPECDAELEVVETDPVELDWAYDDDFEDEDEDEDD